MDAVEDGYVDHELFSLSSIKVCSILFHFSWFENLYNLLKCINCFFTLNSLSSLKLPKSTGCLLDIYLLFATGRSRIVSDYSCWATFKEYFTNTSTVYGHMHRKLTFRVTYLFYLYHFLRSEKTD